MHPDSLITLLTYHDACDDARAWAEGRLVDEAAYLACPRGDWLLWILTRLGLPRPQIVLAACACARTALRYVPAGEERPRRAIEAAEAWGRGGEGAPTLAEVRAAADAARAADGAYAAAYAAARAARAARAAAAAARATYAAYAAYAAAAAAAASAASAYAAYAAACATCTKVLAECADIVRGIIPWEAVEPLLARRT